MSGHSKWSQIKRQKGVADTRRGQVFTKLGREITIAVRQGGNDPDANPRLRLAIQRAKDQNMPIGNIERAIKRGTGQLEEAELAEVTCEGYGPGGVAILVQAVTDNRNRTIAEIRHFFSKAGCSLGGVGCVSWLFEPKGIIIVESGKKVDAEELALEAIDAGADDIKIEDTTVEIYTKSEDLETVRKRLEEKKIPLLSAELSLIPKTLAEIDEKQAIQTLKLLEKLEDIDGVQHAFTNADFPDSVLEEMSA